MIPTLSLWGLALYHQVYCPYSVLMCLVMEKISTAFINGLWVIQFNRYRKSFYSRVLSRKVHKFPWYKRKGKNLCSIVFHPLILERLWSTWVHFCQSLIQDAQMLWLTELLSGFTQCFTFCFSKQLQHRWDALELLKADRKKHYYRKSGKKKLIANHGIVWGYGRVTWLSSWLVTDVSINLQKYHREPSSVILVLASSILALHSRPNKDNIGLQVTLPHTFCIHGPLDTCHIHVTPIDTYLWWIYLLSSHCVYLCTLIYRWQ